MDNSDIHSFFSLSSSHGIVPSDKPNSKQRQLGAPVTNPARAPRRGRSGRAIDPFFPISAISPSAENLWGELLQLASPSSAAAPVSLARISKLLEVTEDIAEKCLDELLSIGAVLPPSNEGLQKLGSGKRIPGVFVYWEGRNPGRYLRVIEPERIRQRIFAYLEWLRRQDQFLASEERLAESTRPTQSIPENERVRNAWIHTLHNGSIARAEAAWRSEFLRMESDAAYLSKPAATKAEEVFKIWAHAHANEITKELDHVREQRKAIATQLTSPLNIPNPRWESKPDSPYKREKIPRAVQREVWRRDHGRCAQCESNENLEFDHIIPVTRGGATTVRNLQLLCESCNRRKNNRI